MSDKPKIIDVSMNYYWAKAQHEWAVEAGSVLAAGYKAVMDALEANPRYEIRSETAYAEFLEALNSMGKKEGKTSKGGKEK